MDQAVYAYSTDNGNTNSYNVTNSHNNIVNVNNIIADEGPENMLWLSPLDPVRRHQDVRIDRLDGVGNWFLETSFGSGGVVKLEQIRQSYFVTGIRERGRHI